MKISGITNINNDVRIRWFDFSGDLDHCLDPQNFKGFCIIVLTSNIGSDMLWRSYAGNSCRNASLIKC